MLFTLFTREGLEKKQKKKSYEEFNHKTYKIGTYCNNYNNKTKTYR